jgi:hypothetical protein
MSGKGSRSRPFSVSQEEFSDRWDTIFKKENTMQVRVEQKQEEIGRCGCGRSPTGKCIGWHGLSESAFQAQLANYVAEEQAKEDK